MKYETYEDMMYREQEEAEKEATDSKHLKDGLNRKEKDWDIRSGYGKREKITTE